MSTAELGYVLLAFSVFAFLARRPDLDPGRIGGIGLSVGGEPMLATATESDALKDVCPKAPGDRTFSEDTDQDSTAAEKVLGAPLSAIKTASIAVFANQPPATNLKQLIGMFAPRPVFIIAAPNSPHGEDLNTGCYEAAHESKALWEIPESKHVGGLGRDPRSTSDA